MAFGDADASTPAFVSVNSNWTSTGATSASFTPPAGSLVVLFVMADTSSGANPGNETVTDSIAGATGWTFKIRRAKPDSGAQAGTVAWWEKVYASSPGAITVTVVGNATGAASGGFSTRVVAGCASSEGHAENSNTASAVSLSITSSTDNARGVVAVTDWNVQANMTAGTGQTAVLASSVGSGPDTRVYVGIQNAVTHPAGSVTMSTASPTSGNACNAVGGFLVPSAGGTDATATPSTVAATSTVPAPTLSTGSVVTLSTIAATSTVPAPTIALGVAITPGAVAAVAAVPAPSLSTGSTVVLGGQVSVTSTVPTPTISTGSVVTLSAVVATAAVPSPAVVAGGSATTAPATVAAVAGVPAPTLSTGSVVTLGAPIAATSVVPSPTVAIAALVQLQQIAAMATFTAPNVSTGSTVTLGAVIAATASVPSPTVTTLTSSAGVVGNVHGPLPLAVGAITVHTGSIAGAVT